MHNKSSKVGVAVGLLAMLLAASAIHALAQTAAPTTIYSFSDAGSSGRNTDGGGPSSLIQANDGNLYGTASGGGANGTGTIFKITPSGAFTVLYTFSAESSSYPYGNSDGAGPTALIQASDGNIYGTCHNGGANSYGSIFKITTGSAFTTLYSFNDANDGGYPEGGLIQASDGNLYGTTPVGGANNCGTIYRITLSGAFTTLHSFTSGDDGRNPETGLIQASDGNLYGTAFLGGANQNGTIFEITLSGAFTILYTFSGDVNNMDGGAPGGLIQASDGNLYGVTWLRGANGDGTIFMITLSGAFDTLYSFTGTEGLTCPNALVEASDGNLYSTCAEYASVSGDGTIFQMTQGGNYSLLHSFSGPDGVGPGALILASSGTLYGTTAGGGANGTGTIYALVTPPILGTPPTLSSLSPSSADAAGSSFTLTLKGSGFVDGATVNWNGAPLTTTLVSSKKVTASVPASDIASRGAAVVTAVNPGGAASNAQTFVIDYPVPVLSSLSKSSANAGRSALTITLTGSNFLSVSSVEWTAGGTTSTLATTYVSATQITATVPSALLANAGSASVSVLNPAPGGGLSSGLDFTIK